ncbi:MAG: glycosyltransferase family 39 protein [Candidatus Zambryskibacteria bacterium]|nr:glycosyltransferase family 39 protein [Candidatus Zambryskibacteria bacterium]
MINKNNVKDFISQNKWLIGILLACFILSISYAFYFQITPLVDADAYDTIAQNIVNGIGYRENPEVSINSDNALLRVGPIYEYFLAGIYKIFGHSYKAVWIIQALLRVVSTLFLYLTVILIFKDQEKKKKIALLSAAVFAFYPDLIEISAMLMSETLYLFFVCLFFYAFFKYLNVQDKKWLWGLGFISSLAVLARPPLLFILPVVIFYFLRKKDWKSLFIYGFILIVVFTPWTVRNYSIHKNIIPFGVAGSANFWIGNHVGANGEQETNEEIDTFINTHDMKEINEKSITEFKNYVFNHPANFVTLSLSRANKYFSVLRPMGFWFYSSGWKQALFVLSSAIFSFLVLIFSLAGIIRAFKLKEKFLYYLLAFTILTPLILFITVVETRYRFQIYPLLAVFTSYFILSLKEKNKEWFKILGLSLAIILVNGVVDGLTNFEHFKEKLLNKWLL